MALALLSLTPLVIVPSYFFKYCSYKGNEYRSLIQLDRTMALYLSSTIPKISDGSFHLFFHLLIKTRIENKFSTHAIGSCLLQLLLQRQYHTWVLSCVVRYDTLYVWGVGLVIVWIQ